MAAPTFILILILGVVATVPAAAADSSLQEELTAANALLAEQKIPEARAAFEKILAHAPDNPDANCAVGLFACNDGDWEKALRCEGKALASDPNNARYQFGWGEANGISALKAGIFSKIGYAKKCLAAYERAAALEPNVLQYHWALLNYYQQAPGIAGGDLAKAHAQVGEIKRLNLVEGCQALASLCVVEKKYDQAFAALDDALRASPDDYALLYGTGKLAISTGQHFDRGIAAFKRCLELTPKPGQAAHDAAWGRLGQLYELKGDRARAREAYENALKLNPASRSASEGLKKLNSAGSK